jgi:broad specificity phosphatase PhoE
MPQVYLVRHSQASFGSHDYDNLSDLGRQQARWLGEYLALRGFTFDRVITGTQRRHRQTAEEIGAILGWTRDPERHPGLNEYDFESLFEAYLSLYPDTEVPQSTDDRKRFFVVLRKAMLAWAAGELDHVAPEPWPKFESRVGEALGFLRGGERAGHVLVVSSGGPIGMMVRLALEAPAATAIKLNLQIRNSSIAELHVTEKDTHLCGFNMIPHLDLPERRHAITYG